MYRSGGDGLEGSGGSDGEIHLRLALDAGQMAIWDVDAVTHAFAVTPELNRLLGFRDDETPDIDAIRARYFPGERERLTRIAAETLARGDSHGEAEFRYVWPDGSVRWLMLRAAIIRDRDGAPLRYLGVLFDTTGHRAAELETARAAAMKTAVLESALDCIITIDEDGRVIEWNAAAEHTFGHGRGEALGRDLADLIVPPHLRDAHNAGMRHYLATGEGPVLGKRIEVEALRSDGTIFPVELAISPVQIGTHRYFTAFLRDITVRREQERRSQLLARELAHRIKNTLALVQTITGQTMRQAADLSSAEKSIQGRLAALANAQESLVSGNWHDAPMRELVASALAPYGGEGERFAICGPEMNVEAKQALALSLALHELATNAAKYGALGSNEGKVSVAWTIDADRFSLEWKETGGPAVSEPTRNGFGSRMIERALGSYFDGTARLHFEPDGLRFVLDAPAPQGGDA